MFIMSYSNLYNKNHDNISLLQQSDGGLCLFFFQLSIIKSSSIGICYYFDIDEKAPRDIMPHAAIM